MCVMDDYHHGEGWEVPEPAEGVTHEISEEGGRGLTHPLHPLHAFIIPPLLINPNPYLHLLHTTFTIFLFLFFFLRFLHSHLHLHCINDAQT